jgi:hypothetical protein
VLLKCFIAVEFSAVVEGDCLKVGVVFLDGIQGGYGHRGSRSRTQLLDDGEA